MQFIPSVIFAILLLATTYLAFKKYRFISRNIHLGRPEDLGGNPAERWKHMLLFAIGQKKMFRRWIPAILHIFIYVSFVIVNIEVLEIIIDGLTGSHRVFAPFAGKFYTWMISLIEVLSALALMATLVFLWRRNVMKVKRFTQPELKGWAFRDANLILLFEVVLVSAILTMNAADLQLQWRGTPHYPNTGNLLVSGFTANWLSGVGTETLIFMERGAWWLHITGIFFFLLYIPHSKHLHIFLSFPNSYYYRMESQGKMTNMPVIMNEVKLMLDPAAQVQELADPPKTFGAKDVTDLSWKHLMDAYSCTECGRCTDACPANITGKKLSPRKVMMDTRDRLEEVGRNLDLHGPSFADNKALLGDYISEEEIRACTTCNACVEECPVGINPLSIIVELRRYLVMEKSDTPEAWTMMLNNLENNQAPWQFSQQERMDWSKN